MYFFKIRFDTLVIVVTPFREEKKTIVILIHINEISVKVCIYV